MRRFLSLIFLLLSIHGFAQYKTVYSDATTFFKIQGKLSWYWERSTSIFIPVKIETTRVVNEDTLYDNYRVFTNTGSLPHDCYVTSKGYAWTGKNIIMTKGGQELFINTENDTIVFKKYANLNDTWIFFHTRQYHFVATVTGKELESFKIYEDQVTDSVLTISISQVKNEDNSPLSHPFNGKEWKISKKYGFVKAYDLLRFPQDTNALELAGVDKNNVGVKNLTEKEIYDFEIGDEFHISEFLDITDYKRIIQKVLDKSFNKDKDSLIYKISVVENSKNWHYVDGVLVEDIIVKLDTTFLKVPLLPDLKGINEIPFKPYNWIYEGIPFDVYNYQFIQAEPPSVKVKALYILHDLQTINDSCYFQGQSGSSFIEKFEFWQGLGGPYYVQRDMPIMVAYGRELVYYKKSYGEWGTPMDIVLSTYPNKISATVSLSPNPATDRLFISSEGIQNTSYKVFNAEGREVLNGNFIGTEENVDVNSLKAGIYSLMILNEDGVIYTSRFVKN